MGRRSAAPFGKPRAALSELSQVRSRRQGLETPDSKRSAWAVLAARSWCPLSQAHTNFSDSGSRATSGDARRAPKDQLPEPKALNSSLTKKRADGNWNPGGWRKHALRPGRPKEALGALCTFLLRVFCFFNSVAVGVADAACLFVVMVVVVFLFSLIWLLCLLPGFQTDVVSTNIHCICIHASTQTHVCQDQDIPGLNWFEAFMHHDCSWKCFQIPSMILPEA